MRGFEYLADGHHVDDAGNLIACTYVDFRDPAEQAPITALQKASSKCHAILGCETIRISKPGCFHDRGEGLVGRGDGDEGSGPPVGEGHSCTNGWIYCASVEPETPEENAAWREAMSAGDDLVSPHLPAAGVRADVGALAAAHARRTVLLRNTVTATRSPRAINARRTAAGLVVYWHDP